MSDRTARRDRPRPSARVRRPQAGPPVRLYFANPRALLDGFARAQDEPWVDDCHADLAANTLDLRLSPSFGQGSPGVAVSWQSRMRRIAGKG